ncbi:flavin reductase family protein [Pseudodesulfovibrio sediminis]|uniref:Flavodoxin n=1 Tax=Pseudodesulfovibrio sediminis TaxID=2810563 RepID=A0ABM7P5K3_9BACT|nr:flavin reductase family protein [Pseudodesulfovibrio sediminis]BCS88891.1 flavodoxin [Pseudodesulfovibrio sediminis]
MKKSLGAITLAQPTPVWAVGAYDEDGKPNAMIAAWGGIASSDPASMVVSLRPSRHTYAGILKHKAFTISVCPANLAAESDYLGMVSGKNVDKFTEAGLTPVRSNCVDAPYIDECPLVIECELSEIVELGVHNMVIGAIIDVKCDDDKLVNGKHPDITKVAPMIFAPGSRAYHTIGEHVGQAFNIGKKFMK